MADIISYLSPSATLIVGLSVAFIAFQQWRVARNKLRMDLFDRRYKVYDATRVFLSVILRDATFTDSDLFTFYAGTSDAEFLFRSDVLDYLAQIRKRALDMRTHQKVYEPLPAGDERSRHVQAEHDQLLWLSEQLTAMAKTFAPYLRLAHI
jgi:hypothetical protein